MEGSPQAIQHSGAVGSYDLSKLTDDELERVYEIISRATDNGGDQLAKG